MSSFIVEPHEIAYIVAAAMAGPKTSSGPFNWKNAEGDWQSLDSSDLEYAAKIGTMLWNQNVQAVTAKYHHVDEDELPGSSDLAPYIITVDDIDAALGTTFEALQILQSIRYLAHQCDTDEDWKDSESFNFLDSLSYRVTTALIDTVKTIWGAPNPPQRALPR